MDIRWIIRMLVPVDLFPFITALRYITKLSLERGFFKPTEPSHLGLMSAEFTLKTGTLILTIQRWPCAIQLKKRTIVYIVSTVLPMSCDSRAVIDVELLQRCRQRRVIVDLEELAQEIWKWMEMWRETRILDNTQNEKLLLGPCSQKTKIKIMESLSWSDQR